MLGAARIIPEWKELKSEICQKLQVSKELSEAGPVLLSDRPFLVYRASRHPHLMPPICFYSAAATNVFVCFSWGGPGVKQDQARVWLQHVADESVVVEKDVPMAQRVKVLQISHVPSLRLLATYCDDLHLRLFGDHSQGLQLLLSFRSPHSVTSMCYNPETGELVTGAIGSITIWAFLPGPAPTLGISWAVSITGGEFVHCLSVEREARALLALCENTVRLYDYQRRAESRAFQINQGVSLTCCSAHWSQGHLYVGDLAGYVKLWSLETERQEQQFKAHLSAVTSMVCRPAVHTLMTASLDGLLKEWGLGTCELLRRLDVGEPVFQLCFVDAQTFYCRSQHGFSIRTLRNFYQLFNAAGSGLRKLARVPCGPGRARILATTEDGVIRFLSPVTGELLFLTWPFQVLEKALDYAYDPEREELVVTVGTADVYVLDTTTCPSPAKYILRTTENRDDKVLCLAFCRLGLGTQPTGFVFSGHTSGHVRLVSQHAHRLAERKIHKGGVGALCSLSACGDLSYHSPESTFLCSYGTDERIVLSNVGRKGSELELRPMVVIPSNNCRLHGLLLLPGYICALTEQNRLRLWRQAALVPKKINPYWLETSPLHSCSITSFDYCHPLRMLLTGGTDGSVRLWDVTGILLVDFDTSLRFSRVCFANLRGDLLVGCSTNIYFISCIKYLPRRHLKALASQQVGDDAVEDPLPFLPNFLLSFDTVFVPKYVWAGKKTKRYEGMESLTSHREVTLVKSTARVVDSAKVEAVAASCPEASVVAPLPPSGMPDLALDFTPARTPAKRPLASPVESPGSEEGQVSGESGLLLKKHFLLGGTWPIAPDGYIPNSVIRARLWPFGTPQHLKCSIKTTQHRRLLSRKPVKVQEPVSSRWWEEQGKEGKAARKLWDQPTSFVDLDLPRDVLAEIVAKNWLRHKPSEVTLESVLRAVLGQMDDVPLSVYSLCTTCLVQICEAYVLPPQLQTEAAARLYEGVSSKNGRMRQIAWETLGKMELLSRRDVVPLAQALLDEDKQVRDQARSLMDSVAGIADKFALKKEIKRQASLAKEQPTIASSGMFVPYSPMPPGPEAEGPAGALAALSVGEVETLLAQVETKLTDNLYPVEEGLEPTARGQVPGTKRPNGAELLGEEAGGTDTLGRAKKLQLFAQTKLPRTPGAAKDAPVPRKQGRPQDKLPKIQLGPRHPTAPITVPSGKEATVKLPKVARPPLGPRHDMHSKLFKEMVKKHMLQKKHPSEPLPSQPSRTSDQPVQPKPSDPFLIDPSQQYGAGSSRWRDDLCRLLNLRIAPSADDRSALEELLASARQALAKRSGSWGFGKSSSSFFKGAHKRYSAEEREQLEQLVERLGSCLAEGALAKEIERAPAEGILAKGAQGSLAEVALDEEILAERAEGSLAEVALDEEILAERAEGSLAEVALDEEILAERAEGSLAEVALDEEILAERAEGSLAEVALDEEILAERAEGSLAEVAPAEGILAERAEGSLAEVALDEEILAERAEGSLAEVAPAEGILAKRAEGSLAEVAPAEGILAKRAEGGLAKVSPAEGILAEGAEGSLAEGALAKGEEGGLAKVALAKEVLAKRAEGGLAKVSPAEGILAEGAEGSLAEGALAKGEEGGLAKVALAKEVLAKRAEGGLAKVSPAEGILAEGAEGSLAEGALAKGEEGGLAKVALAKEVLAKRAEGGLAKVSPAEGILAEGAEGSLAEGALAKGEEGGLAKVALAKEVLADGEKGGLAKVALAKEVLADGEKGGLAKVALAEEVLADGTEGGPAKEPEGVPAEGDISISISKGVLAEGGWAEGAEGDAAQGAEQVFGGRESKAPAGWEDELARGSPGTVAVGVEGQVWQRLQPLLEILADPAKLESTDSSELLGQLQALRQCPSTEHRVALESTLAMAAQVLGEEDASLGRAVSLCALLASRGQQLPEAAVCMELREVLQTQPCPDPDQMKERLASAQAQLQASAERMAQEWAWWREADDLGQPSLEPAELREDEEEAAWLKMQPPPFHKGRARARGPQAQQHRLLQRGTEASGPREWGEAAPVDRQREKVDLYLPDRLWKDHAGRAEAPQQGEVGAAQLLDQDISWDKLLALYQVMIALKQCHGPNSQAWREQFRRLAKLYGLQWPLSRALIRHLEAADRRGSKSIPAKATQEVHGQRQATLGQRILYQILHPAPRKLPTFCGVIPLSYQNNVHALQPLGEARYGAMALAWRTACRDRQGQLPKLHLGVG